LQRITRADSGSHLSSSQDLAQLVGSDAQPIATGQELVLSLIELKNGELISSGPDGTLLFLSPQRVAKKACQEG